MLATSSLLLSSAFSLFANVAMSVAFMVVILSVVRRHRPDAVPLLASAVALELLLTIASYAASLILPGLASPLGGMTGYATAQAINNCIFTLAHMGARLLLLWGIVRLARPADALD